MSQYPALLDLVRSDVAREVIVALDAIGTFSTGTKEGGTFVTGQGGKRICVLNEQIDFIMLFCPREVMRCKSSEVRGWYTYRLAQKVPDKGSFDFGRHCQCPLRKPKGSSRNGPLSGTGKDRNIV